MSEPASSAMPRRADRASVRTRRCRLALGLACAAIMAAGCGRPKAVEVDEADAARIDAMRPTLTVRERVLDHASALGRSGGVVIERAYYAGGEPQLVTATLSFADSSDGEYRAYFRSGAPFYVRTLTHPRRAGVRDARARDVNDMRFFYTSQGGLVVWAMRRNGRNLRAPESAVRWMASSMREWAVGVDSALRAAPRSGH